MNGEILNCYSSVVGFMLVWFDIRGDSVIVDSLMNGVDGTRGG